MSAVLLIPTIIETMTKLAEAYAKMRALAVSQGATPEQLAEADARFAYRAPDPLKTP